MTETLVPEQSNQLTPRQTVQNNLKHRTAHTFGCCYNLPASVYPFVKAERRFQLFTVNHRKPQQPNLSISGGSVKVAQLCPTLCDPMDYTVLGILQARILEWVAVPFSRGSSQPRDQTQFSHIAGRFFTS